MDDALARGRTKSAGAPIRVLFCAEPKFFQPLAVAATSVIANAPGATLDFHVMTCDRDTAAEDKLRQCFAGHAKATLSIHHVDPGRVGDFFVDQHITKETYLRLLAPDVLPRDIERIIYLDCDLIVLDDLRDLWRHDLGGRTLAAAPDYPRIASVISPERFDLLGMPAGSTYVNAGVLVMDLIRWRREDVTRRLADYIARMGARLALHDQDAINAVLCDDISLLDCRWNVQTKLYLCRRASWPQDHAATLTARRDPAILHFTGPQKPWLFRSRTPRKRDYLRYQRLTPWRDATPPLAGPLQRAEYRLDRALSSVGVDYLQPIYYATRLPAKLGLVHDPYAATSQAAARP